MSDRQTYLARSGDVVEVGGHSVHESRRLGEIVEVLGEPDHPHFRVRWDDGRETIFYPSSDATIHPGPTSREEES